MLTEDRQEAELEAQAMAACHEAFHTAFPLEPLEASEMCNLGSWGCPQCPWAKTSALHPTNMKGN